ncbi:MAG: S8 family serine peptidase [Desulfobulbaceae bacterium]|nr:S8 family serine peptidase [Desulfobulbaceae bacterium]
MRVSLLLFCLFTVPVHVLGLGSVKGSHEQHEVCVPDELLVKYQAATADQVRLQYREKYKIRTLRYFQSIGVDHVQLPQGVDVEEALQLYAGNRQVEYAEPNYYRYADIIPDDPFFGQLWGMDNNGQDGGLADADIDAPEAWNITTGNGEVVVAVIDSGIDYDHPDLAANIWTNPAEIAGNGIDDDANGYIDDVRGWDFIKNDNAPVANDARGHGTHVAGIIAAEGDNAAGVAGVSWSAKIMALRFLNAFGMGTTADAILAMEYANSMGADIINNSWGGGGYSQALKDVIDISPALVVCAAGNSGTDNDVLPHYPASYTSDNLIAVAATDNTDNLATFSNYGYTAVDVAAPGKGIVSCVPGRRTLWSDDFDDGKLDGWLKGGKKNKLTWNLTQLHSVSASYSLADSPGGEYMNRAKTWIRGPLLDFSGHNGGKLEFLLRGTSEPARDQLFVETSLDDVTWTPMAVGITGVGYFVGVSGTLAEWTPATVDLEAYDGYPAVYFRFLFTSNRTISADGWYIDDVTVTTASSDYDGTEYRSFSGTSMAAPHVSGIAALVKGENMELSPQQVREIIKNSAEDLPSLIDKVYSGGRVNAFDALIY